MPFFLAVALLLAGRRGCRGAASWPAAFERLGAPAFAACRGSGGAPSSAAGRALRAALRPQRAGGRRAPALPCGLRRALRAGCFAAWRRPWRSLRPHLPKVRSGAAASIVWHSARVRLFGSRSFGILALRVLSVMYGPKRPFSTWMPASGKSRIRRFASAICFSRMTSSARSSVIGVGIVDLERDVFRAVLHVRPEASGVGDDLLAVRR